MKYPKVSFVGCYADARGQDMVNVLCDVFKVLGLTCHLFRCRFMRKAAAIRAGKKTWDDSEYQEHKITEDNKGYQVCVGGGGGGAVEECATF
jgi:hypothetical protein